MAERREEYGNGLYVQGYLITAINSTTDTTLIVAGGDWSVFGTIDSNFQVTIRVDGEIMLVTAISGTGPWTFTVSRNFPATAHNVGTLVYPVLTGPSLKRLYRQSLNGVNITARRELNFIPIGFDMSLEDNPATESTRVRMYMPTDGQYGEMRAPTVFNWTQLAQADSATLATVVYNYNGITLRQFSATSATHRLQALYRTRGTYGDPQVFGRMKLLFCATPGSTAKFGMLVRNSETGVMYCWGFQIGSTVLHAWLFSDSNTLTTDIGDLGNLQIKHNHIFLGDTRTGPEYSADGINYYGFPSGSNYTSLLTPDQIGFWIDTPPGEMSSVRLVSHTN